MRASGDQAGAINPPIRGDCTEGHCGARTLRLAGVAFDAVVVEFRVSIALGINHPAHEQNAAGLIVPNHE